MEIRHLCARDILRPLLGESAVADEYERLRASHEYRHFFSLARDGVLGDRRGFDLVGRGAMWRFAEAVARGYDRRELAVRETAGFLIGRCRGGSGGFVMNWTPAVEAACVTGAMVRRLIEAGFDDDSIGRGIAWITSHQRHDGGWLHCPIAGTADVFRLLLLRRAGSGLSREEDRMVGSCVFASFECLMALLEYEERRGVGPRPRGERSSFFSKTGCLWVPSAARARPAWRAEDARAFRGTGTRSFCSTIRFPDLLPLRARDASPTGGRTERSTRCSPRRMPTEAFRQWGGLGACRAGGEGLRAIHGLRSTRSVFLRAPDLSGRRS